MNAIRQLLGYKSHHGAYMVTTEDAVAAGTVPHIAGAMAALHVIARDDGAGDGDAARDMLDRCGEIDDLSLLANRRESVAHCMALMHECLSRLHAALDRCERAPTAEPRGVEAVPWYLQRRRCGPTLWLNALSHALQQCVPAERWYHADDTAAATFRDAGMTAAALRALELRDKSFFDPAFSLLLSLFPMATKSGASAAAAAPLKELLHAATVVQPVCGHCRRCAAAQKRGARAGIAAQEEDGALTWSTLSPQRRIKLV